MPARKSPIKGRKPGTGSKRKRPGVPTSGRKPSARKKPPELDRGGGPKLNRGGGKMYAGGSKTFNEETGRHEHPDGTPMKHKNARMGKGGPKKEGRRYAIPKTPKGKDKGGPVRAAAKRRVTRRRKAA